MWNHLKKLAGLKAKEMLETAIEVRRYRENNLSLYGQRYKKTLEFASLQLREQILLLKYEICKGLFKID